MTVDAAKPTNKPVLKNVTDRDRELFSMAPIMQQMPVVFANGWSWTHFRNSCGQCNKIISDDLLRGVVIERNEHMHSVEAIGLCPECDIMTRVTCRLYDDKSISGLYAGAWRTRQLPPRSFFYRLGKALGLIN